MFIGRTDVVAETPILWPPDAQSWLMWKDPDAGKDLKAGGEGDDRGWDGWMASPTQWTWVWVDSGSCWWTGRPDVLQFMGSQRVRHEWAAELNCLNQHRFITSQCLEALSPVTGWLESNCFKFPQGSIKVSARAVISCGTWNHPLNSHGCCQDSVPCGFKTEVFRGCPQSPGLPLWLSW